MKTQKPSRAAVAIDLQPTGYSLSITEQIEMVTKWRDNEMACARSFQTNHPDWAAVHAQNAKRHQRRILVLRREARSLTTKPIKKTRAQNNSEFRDLRGPTEREKLDAIKQELRHEPACAHIDVLMGAEPIKQGGYDDLAEIIQNQGDI